MFFVQISRAHSGMNFEAETLEEALDRASVYNKDFPNEITHVVISKEPIEINQDHFSTRDLKNLVINDFDKTMKQYPWTTGQDKK